MITALLALPRLTNGFSKPHRFKQYQPEVNKTQGSKVLLLKNILSMLVGFGLNFLNIPPLHLENRNATSMFACKVPTRAICCTPIKGVGTSRGEPGHLSAQFTGTQGDTGDAGFALKPLSAPAEDGVSLLTKGR